MLYKVCVEERCESLAFTNQKHSLKNVKEMPDNFELHFQEGFSGQLILVKVDGLLVSQLEIRTRLQTGLAHIERLKLTDGSEIEIALPDRGSSVTAKANRQIPYIVINLRNDRLLLEANKSSPGYM